MKVELLSIILILATVCGQVKGIEEQQQQQQQQQQQRQLQGIKVEKEEKPTSNFPDVGKGLLALKKIREEIPELIKKITEEDVRGPEANESAGLGLGTLFNTLLGSVNSVYQDLLNRQQAFINLLTCGNCVNEGWEAIMDVATTIPELEWVYKPSDKTGATTFFTAVHRNGSVTGIGGSVIDGKPIAEYAFGNDGIKHRLPKKDK